MKKFIFTTLFVLLYSINSYADNTYFIDFTKVLNNSKPGAEAQNKIKGRFSSESKKFLELEKSIRKEESEIISQKKTLPAEDYKKKVQALRKKVAETQKNKKISFNNLSKLRSDARKALLKELEPIIRKYMEENKIKMVINKQSVILGDTNLEITKQIIEIVNKEVSSIKLN